MIYSGGVKIFFLYSQILWVVFVFVAVSFNVVVRNFFFLSRGYNIMMKIMNLYDNEPIFQRWYNSLHLFLGLINRDRSIENDAQSHQLVITSSSSNAEFYYPFIHHEDCSDKNDGRRLYYCCQKNEHEVNNNNFSCQEIAHQRAVVSQFDEGSSVQSKNSDPTFEKLCGLGKKQGGSSSDRRVPFRKVLWTLLAWAFFCMSGSAVVVTASSEETAIKPIPANGLMNSGLGAAGDLDPYWKIISVPSDTPGFTAGSNAIIMTANPLWGSSPAWSSKYIGVTADGETGVPGGNYIYELTFASAKYNTTSVAVYFLVDDQVTSVVVSDGHGGVIQSVTMFSGSGSGNTFFSSFTLTAFGPAVTILTFTVLNIGRRPSGLLVQFGEFTYIPGCPNPVPFCPAGTYLMSAGSLSCDSCPAGSSSSEGATSCSPCPAGMISSPSLSLSPSFSSAPSDGLQLYYRFDSVSGSRVGNLANGSVVYDATLQNGAVVSNNQLQLSAAGSQYMQIDSFTTGDAGLTFATWWRSDNSENWAKVFDFGNHVRADNIIMTKNSTDGTLLVQLYVLNSYWRDLSASFHFDTQNAWNHVAWTLNSSGSGTWIVYINGVQVGSVSPAPYPRSILRSNNFLGRSNWESNPPLNGGIKDFRMYSRVLSAAEVHTLFTSTQKIFIGASQCDMLLLSVDESSRFEL